MNGTLLRISYGKSRARQGQGLSSEAFIWTPPDWGLSGPVWAKSRLSQGLAPVPLENLKILPNKSGTALEYETTGTRPSYKELALHSQGALLQPKTFIAPTLNG